MELGFDIDIVAGMLSVAAVIISIIAYYRVKNLGRVEKAHDLAEYYGDLLDDISLLIVIISEHKEIMPLINKIDPKEIGLFSKDELQKKYKEPEMAVLRKFFMEKAVDPVLVQKWFTIARRQINFDDAITEKDLDAAAEMKQEIIRSEFELLVTRFINKLEWFSMAFTSRLANDKVVYQSLHQSFLEIVKLLYFRISYENNNTYDKYFVNIIHLFLRWRERRENDIAGLNKIEAKNEAKKRKIEDKQTRPPTLR